jgi:hypothetical protein
MTKSRDSPFELLPTRSTERIERERSAVVKLRLTFGVAGPDLSVSVHNVALLLAGVLIFLIVGETFSVRSH